MNLLCIETRQQCTTRGPAASCVVELGEPQSIFGERIELRRFNLATVAAKVRIARSSANMITTLGGAAWIGGQQSQSKSVRRKRQPWMVLILCSLGDK